MSCFMEPLNSMVLKTGTVKEPENVLITGFMVGPDGRTGDVINNLIITYLNYINN